MDLPFYFELETIKTFTFILKRYIINNKGDCMNQINIFDKMISSRYQTVLNNIKNKSNSFYDSYLDLLEATIKFMLEEDNIEYRQDSTCGGIIKSENVGNYLLNNLKLDKYTFDKLPDYIKKCNDHKHKKEKTLSEESVINYLNVYFNLINYYCGYKHKQALSFNKDYLISIFGETEKLNREYKNEVSRLKLELYDAYTEKKITDEEFLKCKNMLSSSEIERFSLEEQNTLILSQIEILSSIKLNNSLYERLDSLEKKNNEILNKLNEKQVVKEKPNVDFTVRNFVFNSEKNYIYMDELDFRKNKLIVSLSCIVLLITGLVQTIIFTKAIGLYSTFSLFENIWMLSVMFIFFYNLKYKKVINHEKLACNSSFKFELDQLMLWNNTLIEKKKYKVFRVLSYISSICNIIYSFSTKVIFVYYLLTIIFIVTSIIIAIYKNRINEGYFEIISFTGKKTNSNEIVTIYYSLILQKYLTEEEFKEYKIKNYN